MEVNKIERNENGMEKGVIRTAKSCAACSIGAACLADGPIPDFEVAGLLGLYGLF